MQRKRCEMTDQILEVEQNVSEPLMVKTMAEHENRLCEVDQYDCEVLKCLLRTLGAISTSVVICDRSRSESSVDAQRGSSYCFISLNYTGGETKRKRTSNAGKSGSVVVSWWESNRGESLPKCTHDSSRLWTVAVSRQLVVTVAELITWLYVLRMYLLIIAVIIMLREFVAVCPNAR